MENEKVQVRIKPLHNIGGVGKAGDVVWMTPEDAEAYVRDGYVEYVSPPATPLSLSTATSPQMEEHNLGGEHAVMKPEVKRGRKVVRKK